jgi:hypothetical protein
MINGNKVKGSSQDLFYGNIPAAAWEKWRKVRKPQTVQVGSSGNAYDMYSAGSALGRNTEFDMGTPEYQSGAFQLYQPGL